VPGRLVGPVDLETRRLHGLAGTPEHRLGVLSDDLDGAVLHGGTLL